MDEVDLSNTIECPNCKQFVPANSRECEYCGVNLALAAGIAARALTPSLVEPASGPMAPEILVPRLGEILLEKGVLTKETLQDALTYSQKQAEAGKARLFGQNLLEMKLIDRETLDQVVTEQILQLQQALQASNRQLERRVLERTHDLQVALNRLSELNELKNNFISNISHELRTPLTHIKGYLNLLADGSLGPLSTEQSNAVGVLVRAETRLEQLIEDLIQFSLIARGQLSLNVEPVNVKDLLAAASNRGTRQAAARHIGFHLEIDEEIAFVRADREKISWVLLQLLDNAVKFTPQDGDVTLGVKLEEGGLACFRVIDTGIGIAPNRLMEIFESFHQLDNSNTRRFGGTGLGLALVKRIVEAHGSIIKVQSEPGKGSCFEFNLPATKQENV